MKYYFYLVFIVVNFLNLTSIFAEPNSIIAVVNDDIITSAQLEEDIDAMMTYQKLKQRPDKNHILELLNNKIDILLQIQQANRMEITVKPEVLNESLEVIAKENNIPLNKLKQTSSYNKIVAQLKINFLLQRLQSLVGQEVSKQEIPEDELKDAYQKKIAEEAKYHLYNIVLTDEKKAQELQVKLNNSPSLFSDFAKKYSKAYNAENGGNIGYLDYDKIPALYQKIVLSLQKNEISNVLKNNHNFHIIKLADKQLNTNQLEKHLELQHIFISKDNTNQHVFKTMLMLYEKIKQGTPFDTIAKQYSQGEYAKNGGYVPLVSLKKLPVQMQNILLKLEKNEISRPFQSDFGWHIVRKLKEKNIDAKLEETKQTLIARAQKVAFKKWLSQIRGQSHIIVYEHKIE